MRISIVVALLAALGSPGPALAAAADTPGSPEAAQSAGQLIEGEVRRVDKETRKITIRHGPIPNLDMPPMTMVFQVKDPAMLEQVKAGDKIRFEADKVAGQMTVMRIETAK